MQQSFNFKTETYEIRRGNDNLISKLRFTFSQNEVTKTTIIPLNNNDIDLDHIEVDIDSSVKYVFLNGEFLKHVLISPTKRTAETTTLSLMEQKIIFIR